MVLGIRNHMRLSVSRVSRLSSKEGKVVMLIGDMGIYLVVIYGPQLKRIC